MKLPANTNPALVASKDATRHIINNVLFTNELAVATDGRRLVAITVAADESDTLPALLPAPAVTAACSKKRKPIFAQQLRIVGENATVEGFGEQRVFRTCPESWRDDFPDAAKACPDETKHTLRIGLNPEFLLGVAKAMGVGGKRPGVVLHIDPTNHGAPIYVTAGNEESDESFGVLMPMRILNCELRRNKALSRLRAESRRRDATKTTNTPTK